ncbi:hypothetical protein [Bacillus sp. UNCCL13]|uniref:hypothetical protein n=1 Tax=Bacillus sp. UNCCL13 TaxID=1502772 RepID=UPI001C31A454|nr:hypothetical protein [Bacillus sp. UNCCL13]
MLIEAEGLDPAGAIATRRLGERPQDEFALEKAGIRAFSKIRTGKQATGAEINRQD